MNKQEKEKIKEIITRVEKQAEAYLSENKYFDEVADRIIINVSCELNLKVSKTFLRTISEIAEAMRDILEDEKIKDIEEFKELCQEIETEADIYTEDLIEWLHEDNENINYLTDAITEFNITDGFNALATAQALYKQEILACLIEQITGGGEEWARKK